MSDRTTDSKATTKPASADIEQRLKAVRSAAPPADLLGRLQADLDNAIDEQTWNEAGEPDSSSSANNPSPWWHSPNMRIAAAVVTVVGAGWYFSQADRPVVPTLVQSSAEVAEAEPSVRTEQPERPAALSATSADSLGGQRGAELATAGADIASEGKLKAQPANAAELSSSYRTATADSSSVGNTARQARDRNAMSEFKASDRRADGDQTKESGIPREERISVMSEASRMDPQRVDDLLAAPPEPEGQAEARPGAGTVTRTQNAPIVRTARPAPRPAPSSPAPELSRNEPVKDLERQVAEVRTRLESSSTTAREVEAAAYERSPADVALEKKGEHEKLFSRANLEEDADVGDEVDPRLHAPRRALQEFDAMYFRDYGISQFVKASEDAESTFALEVDTGSYSIVRSYLNRGALPPPAAVRVEEFLNAFDYGDAAPRRGDFAISVDGAATPYVSARKDQNSAGHRAWLRVGIKAKELSDSQRKPTALTFLVDTSGSMAQENRIEIVRQSLRLLVDELKRGDSVAIVTYGSRGQVLLDHTSDRSAILRTIDRLHPNGSTNLQEGMEYAYRIAAEQLQGSAQSSDQRSVDRLASGSRPMNHRVLLLSDGVANVGLTDAENLLRNVAQWASRGIELTSVGVGMGNYNDELLERLADRGDGRYAYVDRMEEARRLFVEGLTGTLQTVGADARAQVTFDPDVVQSYRLLGYENRDIPDASFRNRSTDGGEIGAGHTVTALYELAIDPSVRRRSQLASISLVYRPADAQELTETTRSIRVSDVVAPYSEASPALRLATLSGRFAELLRVSPYVEGDLSELFLEAQQLIPEFPGDRRVVELADLIGKARDLMRHRN